MNDQVTQFISETVYVYRSVSVFIRVETVFKLLFSIIYLLLSMSFRTRVGLFGISTMVSMDELYDMTIAGSNRIARIISYSCFGIAVQV